MNAHDARAEAERRLAAGELYDLQKSRITTFIEGAQWQASRPFTEEDVEAASATIKADFGMALPEMVARAALDAVTAHRTKGETP